MSDHSARAIEEYLLARIIGQEKAVRRVAVAVSTHMLRLAYQGETPLGKANLLLMGPTGSGKTAIARALADYMDVPFAALSATAITEAGFVGLDPEYGFIKLIRGAGGDLAAAGRGIVHFDEIDKIARRQSDEKEKGRHPTGIGVQQQLLDILDSRVVTIYMGAEQPPLEFDASRVLFILSGSFVGIEREVQRRTRASQALTWAEAARQVEPSDLIAYGLIPEFVGRVPIIAPLRALDPSDIHRILTEPLGAPMRQYQAIAQSAGARLEVDDAWLRDIAREAHARGTGARGLDAVLHEALESVLYEIAPGRNIRIGASGEVSRVGAVEATG